MLIHGFHIKGAVDPETRCKHYHEENDRIAIKFFCCKQYFPCYQCHQEHGCSKREIWPRRLFSEKAILCGGCGGELTIHEYLSSSNTCPNCQKSFNPGCAFHYHFYFERK